MKKLARSRLRFFRFWVDAFTNFHGALFLVFYIAELLFMLFTRARVRGVEEASYLLFVRTLDPVSLLPNEYVFDVASWFFDFNKIIAYGLISILTEFLAGTLLNRNDVNGLVDNDEQLGRLRKLNPWNSAIWIPVALTLTWAFGGAAVKPPGEPGSTSLWTAIDSLEASLLVYRLVYLLLLFGAFLFLLVSLELLVRVLFHNRKARVVATRVAVGTSMSIYVVLVFWLASICSVLAFTGQGTRDLVSRAVPQVLGGAIIVLMITRVTTPPTLPGERKHRRVRGAATAFAVLPLIAGSVSAFLAHNLDVSIKDDMVVDVGPTQEEASLLRELYPYLRDVERTTMGEGRFPETQDMLKRIIADLKNAGRSNVVQTNTQLVKRVLEQFAEAPTASSTPIPN